MEDTNYKDKVIRELIDLTAELFDLVDLVDYLLYEDSIAGSELEQTILNSQTAIKFKFDRVKERLEKGSCNYCGKYKEQCECFEDMCNCKDNQCCK